MKEQKRVPDAQLIQLKRRYHMKIREFKRRNKHEKSLTSFEVKEVIHEQKGKCYLSGDILDLEGIGTVHFDHKIPISKGGLNNKENLGLCTKQANLAKSDMTVQEFLDFCQKVLTFHNYTVIKNN